jgi:ABC-type phosphate transport system permease subunit
MNKKNQEVNHLSLFLLGCSLLSVGVILTCMINPVFISIMASGISLMAIGIAKRDKWHTITENKHE